VFEDEVDEESLDRLQLPIEIRRDALGNQLLCP
jgi:hypothetical protein